MVYGILTLVIVLMQNPIYIYIYIAQSAVAVEYTDCFSAEG